MLRFGGSRWFQIRVNDGNRPLGDLRLATSYVRCLPISNIGDSAQRPTGEFESGRWLLSSSSLGPELVHCQLHRTPCRRQEPVLLALHAEDGSRLPLASSPFS